MTSTTTENSVQTWKISIVSPISFIPALEEILYAHNVENFPTVSDFEIPDNMEIRLVEGFFNTEPETERLEISVREMAQIFNISPPEITVELLEDKNWVAESQKLLKPIDAGHFYLYGSHDVLTVPKNKIPILMEAGQAFGTGSHETTNGCLLAISELHKTLTPATILDLGCGSGVLAIAASKQWNTHIVASDIDPIATETTIENLTSNDVTHNKEDSKENGITVITSDGFDHPAISGSAPYDLVIANILAGPLQILAPDITANLKENGILILSGLLDVQEKAVLEAYAKEGWVLKKRYPINEWHTLLLNKK